MPETLAKLLSEAFLPHPPRLLGVAVSGGSDSMALLKLLQAFCKTESISLRAVTVDHGLRPEAADEAAFVSRYCASIGVPHDTLVWGKWAGAGNLQNSARLARYEHMADWAKRHGITTIATGHTVDDQAETVLMRLARRSGVDGLSAIQHRVLRHGVTWVRPLLKARREILRAYLREGAVRWINDPSNENEVFDRIKARKVLELLNPLGIDAEALGEVAENMAEARKSLEWQTFLAAKHVVSVQAGAVVLAEVGFRLQPAEIRRRLMIKAINWITGRVYAPRRGALANVFTALETGQAATVGGCHIRRIGGRIWIFREYNAVRDLEAATNELWDDRWKLSLVLPDEMDDHLKVRALGASGLKQCSDWRITGRPYVVLQSTPAVWRGEILVAAPLAGCAKIWHAELDETPDDFFATLLSH
ncbi:tRNA lysidine(34) synthetase TilS [Sulfitobacter sp. F26204]|uniref:tRNA lysidine(34) synthetase TilS n=1 Tax=Sulfitobacter sp. F26204 TaxID=2996014 RepID=UPI00225E0C0B|nr:tRNA lysidine(34) synthetase TilS [Sulfitobacter sp. F26204]MCX7561130.1 tRNA lysidine(34) synthetase TilS [Sulfitobacter sp. F26204]